MNIHFLGVFESIWLNLNGFEDNTLLIKRSGSVDRRPLSDPMVEVRGLRVNYDSIKMENVRSPLN